MEHFIIHIQLRLTHNYAFSMGLMIYAIKQIANNIGIEKNWKI